MRTPRRQGAVPGPFEVRRGTVDTQPKSQRLRVVIDTPRLDSSTVVSRLSRSAPVLSPSAFMIGSNSRSMARRSPNAIVPDPPNIIENLEPRHACLTGNRIRKTHYSFMECEG